MNFISAKLSVATVTMVLLGSACAIQTGGSRTGVQSKDYECKELKELIDVQEKLFIRGFLGSSSLVFASADSCHPILEVPLSSSWNTKDVFSCVVGYRCLNNDTLDDDF